LPLLLFSGLFASADALPGYLSWIQYISPMKYAYTGLVINEFNGRELPNCDPSSGKCSTEYVYSVLGFTNPLGIIPNIVFLIVIYLALVIGAFIILWCKLHTRGGQYHKKKKD
jgi:ABC-type multidrug transport system permease subunit